MQENHDDMDRTTQPDATMDYIFSRIDAIMTDTTYLREALEAAKGSGAERGIGEAIQARERTNQMILDLLHEMYEDVKQNRQPPSEQAREYRAVMSSMRGYPNREFAIAIFDRIYGEKYPKPGYGASREF